VSGDSDFSPLVSKLRENNKIVIGVGVKSSTSDLLIANCDEFIYYDDLVRKEEQRRGRRKTAGKQAASGAKPAVVSAAPEPAPAEGGAAAQAPRSTEAERRQEAFDLVLKTIEALSEERDEDEKIWGSMIKQAIKRQRPGFNESYHGFRNFSELLEEAQAQKLIELEKDEKSGGYIVRAAA
jgi:uncharacterized LabA/DUF88 family protein